jgi:hypothetical protein
MCFFTAVPAFAAAKVKLSTKNVSLSVGGHSTLTLKNADGTVEWSVSKKNIVTVYGEGTSVIIKGKKAGSAYVKAKYNGKTYKCKVTVTAEENTGESLNCSIELYNYSSMQYITREGQYTGEVKDGVPNGYGTFSITNSKGNEYTVSGTFKNGKLDGSSLVLFNDHYEIYESENGKFIKVTIFDNGVIDENILKDNILYENYIPDENNKYLFHFVDGKEEPRTVIDWLYTLHYDNSFAGFELKLDSAINMDKIRRLSDKKIKKKAEYIEAEKLEKSVTSYTSSVDYLKKACVIRCQEIEPHESWGLKAITIMLLSYDDYAYAVWYEGSLDIHEGDYVSCWFTPFSNVGYENADGTASGATCGIAYIVKAAK